MSEIIAVYQARITLRKKYDVPKEEVVKPPTLKNIDIAIQAGVEAIPDGLDVARKYDATVSVERVDR